MSRSTRIAVICLLILLTYYEVYRWVPLGRWNWQFRSPVQNDQSYPDIVIGALLLFFTFSFVRTWRVGTRMCVVLLGLWVGVRFFDWWLPYLQDSASNAARYSFYAPHTQILPVIGHHYPPDGGHAVLDFLLYPTWFACFLERLPQEVGNVLRKFRHYGACSEYGETPLSKVGAPGSLKRQPGR